MAFLEWVKLCKNWYLRIFEYMGMVNGDAIYSLRNGLKIKLRSQKLNSDSEILGDIFFKNPYTKGVSIPDGSTIVDIGANVGVFSLFVEKMAKKTNIYSFEAHPANFKYLEWNVRKNNLKNIRIFNLAVSGKKGKIKLFKHDKGFGGFSIYPDLVESKTGEYVEVRSTTLNEIIEQNNIKKIDFLKLDCEGSEYEILFKTSKRNLQKIGFIAMEIHRVKDYSIDALTKFLTKNGFIVQEKKDILLAGHYDHNDDISNNTSKKGVA